MAINKIAGLHLWSVEFSNGDVSLWITTPKRDESQAIEKAQRVLKRYYNPRINRIKELKYHGTLDA